MTDQLKAAILAAGDTYALAVHAARTGGESQAAKAVFAETVSAALAAPTVPLERDTELFGVTADGLHVSLGMIPTPPRMKARELVRETFGPFDDGDGSDAETCFGAMESLIEHMEGSVFAAALQPASERESIEIAGLESSVGHLGTLIDDLRALLSRAMANANQVHGAATPHDGPDLGAFIPAAAFRRFVDEDAALRYAVESAGAAA